MRIGILVLTFFFSLFSVAQELPPIRNYPPSEYGAENQNWSISQAADKVMYFANSKGLLQFNGAKWTHYPLPNESIVRSVNALDDKIYSGGYMEFGYWEKDERGTLNYTSLSQRINGDLLPDEEFWNILSLENFIVFHSLDRIYIYSLEDHSVKWVESDSSLTKIFEIGQTLYFQKLNEGIFRIENGQAVLTYDLEIFRNDEVVSMFERGDDILVLTRKSGFFVINGQNTKPWGEQLNISLSQISVYSAIQLEDGRFALGTISNGLIILNEEGRVQYRIDQAGGLRNNTVLSLFEDEKGTLWLGLDNGISFLNLESAYRLYRDLSGLTGSVYAIVIHNDILYLGTNQGLFYRADNAYEMIPGTEGQVWSLQVIDNALFCGHHAGTFLVEGRKARRIEETSGTWKVSPIPGETELLLQGTYKGLSVLEYSQGSWRFRNRIENFEHSSRFFEMYKDELFVNHEYKGLFRVKLDEAITEAENVRVDTVLRGANSGMIKFREDLFFGYRKGIFKYDPSSQQFEKDKISSEVVVEGGYVSGKLMTDDVENYMWIPTAKNISYITEGTLGDRPLVGSIPLAENERSGISGYESVYGPDKEGNYMFGTSNGYISVDMEKLTERTFVVSLDRVKLLRINADPSVETTVALNENGSFKDDENSLEISYFTPQFSVYAKPEYQFQLSGIYDEWSDWSETASASFSNLPHGSYTFNVRGRIGTALSENTASFSFTIGRPWYLTGLAFVSYFLLAILGSFLIHRTYRKYYHGRQKALIARNKREMALAKAQSDKELIKLKNKQLKKKFRNKNNELAASTLSIIRKNELLAKVKEQLLNTDEDGNTSVTHIVKIIDKSINQNDDWEMFVEAFNHADRKFLKKLKKIHPNLSPNDIKLCAYLRLNLSSKEIAPLLNISPRSVEIKRYRLRKKMNLTHDYNLTDYIMTL